MHGQMLKKELQKMNLEKTINHRIATLAGLLKRQAYHIILENNLTITPEQWVVLYYLWKENGLTVGEISVKTKKDFGNVTRIIVKLEKMGFVEKRKNDSDSRSFKVFYLPKSEAIKKEVQNCWKQSSDIALKGVSQSEQQQLLETIEKIETNILNNMK